MKTPSLALLTENMLPDAAIVLLRTILFDVNSQFFYEEVKGVSGYDYFLPDIHATGLAFPGALPSDFESMIQKVVDERKSKERSCLWLVDKENNALSLGLIKHGFVKIESMVGLVKSVKQKYSSQEPQLQIREVDAKEMSEMIELISDEYECSLEMAHCYLFKSIPRNATRRRFLAFSEQGELVGYSHLDCFNKEKIGALRHAGVLPAFRGQGYYRKLVNHRINLCAELQYSHVITHAMGDTSAGPLLEMQFQAVRHFDIYGFKYGG